MMPSHIEAKAFAGLNKTPTWLGGTSPKDWLFNGEPIRSKARLLAWRALDWTRAYIDLGTSPAGNAGPYWHVPWKLQGEELWARMYPKIDPKWLPLIRHACEEAGRK